MTTIIYCVFFLFFLLWAGLAYAVLSNVLVRPPWACVFELILNCPTTCSTYSFLNSCSLSTVWTALPPAVRTPFWTPAHWAQFELPYTLETNNISIIIDIEEVLRINDKDYSITFSTYFNVEWKEKEPKNVMMTFSVFFILRSAERVMRSDCGRKIFLINLFRGKTWLHRKTCHLPETSALRPGEKAKRYSLFSWSFFYSKESSLYFTRTMFNCSTSCIKIDQLMRWQHCDKFSYTVCTYI